MTTIPERIRDEAVALLCSLSDDRRPDTQTDVEKIGAALLAAEKRGREEAAKIAENCVPHGIHPDDLYRWRQTADTLAAAIRSTN